MNERKKNTELTDDDCDENKKQKHKKWGAMRKRVFSLLFIWFRLVVAISGVLFLFFFVVAVAVFFFVLS